ncbi:MAG: hypothetical protein ACI8Y3_001383, partial [Paraglaciecola sp.]
MRIMKNEYIPIIAILAFSIGNVNAQQQKTLNF